MATIPMTGLAGNQFVNPFTRIMANDSSVSQLRQLGLSLPWLASSPMRDQVVDQVIDQVTMKIVAVLLHPISRRTTRIS